MSFERVDRRWTWTFVKFIIPFFLFFLFSFFPFSILFFDSFPIFFLANVLHIFTNFCFCFAISIQLLYVSRVVKYLLRKKNHTPHKKKWKKEKKIINKEKNDESYRFFGFVVPCSEIKMYVFYILNRDILARCITI